MSNEVNQAAVSRSVIQAIWRFNPPISMPSEDEVRQFHRGIYDLDRSVFQKPIVGPSERMPLAFSRDLRIPGVAVANHQPLMLGADQLELGLIYRTPEAQTWEGDSTRYPDPKGFNKLAMEAYAVFSKVFNGSTVWRFGKVYNYVLGPFEVDMNAWIREHFLQLPTTDNYIEGEVRFVLAKDKANFIHQIKAVSTTDGRSGLLVQLDVNNRDITQSLGANDIRSLMQVASDYSRKDFWKLVVGPGGGGQ